MKANFVYIINLPCELVFLYIQPMNSLLVDCTQYFRMQKYFNSYRSLNYLFSEMNQYGNTAKTSCSLLRGFLYQMNTHFYIIIKCNYYNLVCFFSKALLQVCKTILKLCISILFLWNEQRKTQCYIHFYL